MVVELNQKYWSFEKKCIGYGFENKKDLRIFLFEAPNSFGWALQPLLAVKQNAENVDYKIREKERKTWNPPKSKQKKLKVTLKKLERTRRIRYEGLKKFLYDPKSVRKFVGIVE